MSYESLDIRFRESMLANTAVQAAIGTALYQGQKPQAPNCPYPCAAFQRISTNRLYAHATGQPNASSGWARYQVTVWGSGPNGATIAATAAHAMKQALLGFNLMAQPESPAVLRQAPNFILSERAGNEPQPSQPLFFEAFDAKVWFADQQ